MTCTHANHIADPDFPKHCAEQSRVCTDCGLCLVRCLYCPSLWPDVKCYDSPGFCPQMDGCANCCDQIAGPLTREDTIAVIHLASRLMTEGYRWKSVRMMPFEQRLPWIKREFSNGGSSGGRVSYDGFRRRESGGKGLWARVSHRTGVVTWQQILNCIEAAEVQARACLDCGAITEDLGEIASCYYCHGTDLVPDPLHDGWSAYRYDASTPSLFTNAAGEPAPVAAEIAPPPVTPRAKPRQLTLF